MNPRGLLHAVSLAWRHLAFHGLRSSILVLALGISAALPPMISLSSPTASKEGDTAVAAHSATQLGSTFSCLINWC